MRSGWALRGLGAGLCAGGAIYFVSLYVKYLSDLSKLLILILLALLFAFLGKYYKMRAQR